MSGRRPLGGAWCGRWGELAGLRLAGGCGSCRDAMGLVAGAWCWCWRGRSCWGGVRGGSWRAVAEFRPRRLRR